MQEQHTAHTAARSTVAYLTQHTNTAQQDPRPYIYISMVA